MVVGVGTQADRRLSREDKHCSYIVQSSEVRPYDFRQILRSFIGTSAKKMRTTPEEDLVLTAAERLHEFHLSGTNLAFSA